MSTHPFARRLATLGVCVTLFAAACGVESDGDEATGSTARETTSSSTPTTAGRSSTSRSEGAGGAALMARAADATTQASRAKFSMDMSFTGQGSDPTFSLTAEGAYDLPARKSRVAMDIGELFASIGRAGGSGGTGQSSIPEGDGTMEVLVDGDTAYLRAGLLQGILGGDKPWLKLSAEDAAGVTGGFGAGSQSDPAQLLVFLKSVSGPIEDVGEEEVRGTPTRHLRTSIDLARLAERVAPEERAKVEKLLEGLGTGDSAPELPLEVWVDEDDLVRRLSMTIDGGAAGTAGGGGNRFDGVLEMTVEYFDFGAPVDVSPPPPDQVTDASSLPGAGSGGLFGGGGGSTPPTTAPGG